MTDRRLLEDLGIIVRALGEHTPGDWGDCSINDPLLTIIDEGKPAYELVKRLNQLTAEQARGIVAQLQAADKDSLRQQREQFWEQMGYSQEFRDSCRQMDDPK